MKRIGITLLAAISAVALFNNAVIAASVTGKCRPNPAPFVIPSLQEWNGGSGNWKLSQATRIVIDPAYADGHSTDAKHSLMANPSNLKQYAATFQADIKEVTGMDIEVVVAKDHTSDDIFLTLGADASDPQLDNEGYHLGIGKSGITVRAVTSRGAFWGTRSLLQMLILADEKGYALPRGHARDFPNYHERKFMQDIARKPIPLSDLKEYATLTSFYKFNTLHHHYNDNPAVRPKGIMADWMDKYAGFRLRSDNPVYSKYASNDTSYTKQDLRQFQDFIKDRGLALVPEIDTPAHSLCFTKFHHDWTINNDTARGDWMDLGNQEVWDFVDGLWAEFVDWFDSSLISIGADEYDPTKGNLARKYVNHLHDLFATKFNRRVGMWGSDVRLPGTIEIDKNIHTDHWDWTYSNPVSLVERGHTVCNLNAPDMYLVPRTHSYADFIDSRKIYEMWEPWVFDILDRANKSRNLDPSEPLLTGGGLANWNDFLGESVTRVEIYNRVSRAVGVVAEKMWAGSKNADHMPYAKWAPLAKKLRENIPGITLRRRPETKRQFVISYDFEDGAAADKSGNGYHGKLNGGASVVDGGDGYGKALQLTPGSFVSTPLNGISYPYAMGMWVKPHGNQKANAVLLENEDGQLLISNATNPTVTFVQDGHSYDTQIILPPDAWSHIAFSADGTKTSVFFNMRETAYVNYYNPRWDVLMNETFQVTGPISTIGSKNGNSANALIDGFFVLDRESTGGEMSFIAKHYSHQLP